MSKDKVVKWDVSKGRKYVVVANWGIETTTEFFDDSNAAVFAYSQAEEQGADVVMGKVSRMFVNKESE